uniref:Peroxisomal membrane protein 2 n=2 Tax=Astyanax mexicanus TaxID=7994 RepID=A0A3B1KE25_ASTMX
MSKVLGRAPLGHHTPLAARCSLTAGSRFTCSSSAGNREITMPVRSVSARDPAFPARLLQQYLILLKRYPIITKSVTSGILSALGNLLSQALESKKNRKEGRPAKEVDIHGPVRFAVYGLVVTGPISHYFYHLLEALFPAAEPYCMLKRLLLERLVFAPAFLMLFFTVMNALEGKSTAELQDKVKSRYWPALKMNWKVWTPFQFVNINFVPVQFRVLFANMIALFWYAYLASVRK